MNTWDDEECNQYVGTDSTIFPAFLPKEAGAFIYINIKIKFYLVLICVEFAQAFGATSRQFVVHWEQHIDQRQNTTESLWPNMEWTWESQSMQRNVSAATRTHVHRKAPLIYSVAVAPR